MGFPWRAEPGIPFLCLFSGHLSFTARPTLFTFLLGRSSRTGLQASQGAEEALVCVKFALRRQRMDDEIRKKAKSSPLLPAQGAWPVHVCAHTCRHTHVHSASWPPCSGPSCFCLSTPPLWLSVFICDPAIGECVCTALISSLRLLLWTVLVLALEPCG